VVKRIVILGCEEYARFKLKLLIRTNSKNNPKTTKMMGCSTAINGKFI